MQQKTSQSRIAAVHADAPAERLFFALYRLWMAGYSSRDADYWECAFDVLLRFVGQESAKSLQAEFHLFTRALTEQTHKEIIWRFSACRCLCRDEFLVLRLIAAAQQSDQDVENLAATALLGCGEVDTLLKASRSLAAALRSSNLVLAPIERLPVSINLPHVSHSYTLQ